MENKKTTWDEKHPFGDLRYYTFLDDFDGVASLGETATKAALRVLKHHLEDKMGFELTDEQFIAIFFKVINLGPARPLGQWSFLFGFVDPLRKLLNEQGIHRGLNEILYFFNVRNYDNRHYANIILHVPHSSTSFPESSKVSFNSLDAEERLLIDYYTDELFVPKHTGDVIDSIVFPYCRLYCDVERLINDPLEEKGLGISYTRWVSEDRFMHLRSFSSINEVFKLYSDHHTEVSLKIMQKLGSKLVIDCHSFSSIPNLLNSNPSEDIDICIGYNEDSTCPNRVSIGNIVQYFESRGYRVGINKPFSNSKTFQVPTDYHSVMIEVNKRLYMDEETLEKTDGFGKLRTDIQGVYEILLKGNALESLKAERALDDSDLIISQDEEE